MPKTLASQLSPNQQRKYLAGLRGKAREQRAAEILYRRTHRSNKPFATDKGRTTKRSEHAIAFEQIYGRPAHDVADVARLTGVPRDILEQVYARGMAAWQTGHRPGASQHAWALARVYSFVTGGPTMQGPDKKLAIEAGLAKPNPADRAYSVRLGEGHASVAFAKKDLSAVEIVTIDDEYKNRQGILERDIDLSKMFLAIARDQLDGYPEAQAALPIVEPVRVEQHKDRLELIFWSPYYLTYDRKRYLTSKPPSDLELLAWGGREAAFDDPRTTRIVKALTAFSGKLSPVQIEAAIKTGNLTQDDMPFFMPLVHAIFKVVEVVSSYGLGCRLDMQMANLAIGEFGQIVLLDPIVASVPTDVALELWDRLKLPRKGKRNPAPDTSYRGEHQAPGPEDGAPLWDLRGIYPDDVYGPMGARYYGAGEDYDWEAFAIVQSARGRRDMPVVAYRAVPKNVKGGTHEGDWVTIVRQYAKDHGENALRGDYRIIRKRVYARDLFTNGDSIHEWGYFPQSFVSKSERDPQWERWPGKTNPAPEHGPWIPPPAVAAAAKKGQQLRARQPKSNQCCMATGIARAKQLSSRSPVSYKDLVTMRAWFARHAVDARGKGWGKDSKGFQAFLMWGGAPGKKWCEDILRRLGK